MGRSNKAEFVTYTLVITPATADVPAETATIKIPKFQGGSSRDWLKWSSQFRSLARKKQWTDEQKAHNLVALIDGELESDVEQAAIDAVNTGRSFEEFFSDVGLLSVPADFSEDLDNELWTMKKQRDETVVKFSQRLKENVRMFAELPLNAEEVPEVQQCRYLKRGMPRVWQEKLAAAGIVHDRFSELVLYFSRIEKAEQQLVTREKKNGKQHNGRTKDQQGDKTNSKSQSKDGNKNGDRSERKAKSEKWCSFHKSSSHNTSDCYTVKKKGEQKRVETKPSSKGKRKTRYPRIHKDSESDSDSDASEEFKFIGLVTKKERPASAPLRIPVKLKRGGQIFDALLDSGASKSIINGATLAANVNLGRKFIPASPTVFETMSGSVTSNGTTMAQFILPTLKSDSVITHRFEVIDDSHDAMVIGRDIMNALGLIINFKDKVVQWDENSYRLNTGRGGSKGHETSEQDEQQEDLYPDETKEIADGAVQPEQLLPELQNAELAQKYLDLLLKHQKLYDGHLGCMRFDDYLIPISPDYKPVHAKPYAIPRSQEEKAKEVIQRLINADVLEQIYDSETASPAFFLVKKDGSLRLLIDYRWLNKFLRRSPYYVPRIREILMRLAKAKCISTFDANLGYYARKLARQSRPLTAFCLPFGKFQYKRLPMGISTAPDEYQACMERIFGDLAFVVVYLDDILVFSKDEKEHLEHLRIVFERLESYNVTLNGKKCHILREEVDYLGYTLSAEGVKPQAKKIQAIQQIAVPRNRKELRRFLGMINYYRDMVPNKTTLCKPLHRFTSSKVPFTWLPSDTEAFRAIQRAFAEAVLLSFPDFDKPFQLYADASGTQLGGLVMQETKILACYSRTLNKHQVNHTTMELELLSIVELLREYRTMLLGFPVVVHTDHKNLIYPTETSLRVKRWKLFLSEYRLSLHYIEGVKNVGTDAFSRMRFAMDEGKSLYEEICAATEAIECVMHGPVIRQHQDADEMITKIKAACLTGNNNPDYQLMSLLGCTLVAYQKRVIAPESLRDDLISWYHQNLGHPASERQFKTMRHTFYWPSMETTIAQFVRKCIVCKRAKSHGGKQDFGLLPPRTMKTVNPFDVVHVDLIGPYEGKGYGITMIDQATRWLEVGVLPDKESLTTAESFDREWLCRYPRPRKVIHDQGPEFTGEEFQELLRSYGITAKPITAKNPQANAICERVHLEIGNILRCHDGADWRKVLYYAAFAVRASYHSILNASPGQLVFGQDMISRQLHDANWSYLSKRRFNAILADNDRENDKRLEHFYKPGDQVMLRIPKHFRAKLKRIADGPFPIKTVHNNGTVTLDKGMSTQQVSLRRFPC